MLLFFHPPLPCFPQDRYSIMLIPLMLSPLYHSLIFVMNQVFKCAWTH